MTMDLTLTIATIVVMAGIAAILIMTAVEAVRDAVEHGKGDAWDAGYAAGIAHAIAVYDASVARHAAEAEAEAEWARGVFAAKGY